MSENLNNVNQEGTGILIKKSKASSQYFLYGFVVLIFGVFAPIHFPLFGSLLGVDTGPYEKVNLISSCIFLYFFLRGLGSVQRMSFRFLLLSLLVLFLPALVYTSNPEVRSLIRSDWSILFSTAFILFTVSFILFFIALIINFYNKPNSGGRATSQKDSLSSKMLALLVIIISYLVSVSMVNMYLRQDALLTSPYKDFGLLWDLLSR